MSACPPAWARRLLLVALLASVLSSVNVAPAGASTWTGRQLAVPPLNRQMFGISCPTASFCVAVGGGNTLASSTDPTGGTGSWDLAFPGGGGPDLPNQRQIKGVSCPSPQLCVAVTFEGLIYASTNPTGGAEAWSIADLSAIGPNLHMYGISCPSPSFCAVAAGDGRILTSTDPTGGAAAWSLTQLEGPLELRGVSCTSPALCVVVGDNGDNIRPELTDEGEILTSTNPLGGVWQRAQMPGTPGNLYGVACPSPGLCVTGNTLGNLLVSTNPTGPASAWPTTDGGGSVQITDADCASISQCAAVDNNGDVLTSTDPTGGPGDWTFTSVIPFTEVIGSAKGNAMFGVSCPTVSFCAVSGASAQIFTSEDPFAAPPSPAVKKHGKRRRKGPKRPRTKIGPHPFPTVGLKGRKLTVRFGFYAANHAPVLGFACKMDKRPLRRCRSPKVYRVGAGRHRFRVRAIGWSGLKGPPAKVSFRVCRPPSPPPPTPLPPCRRP
jgi:hypothetical protein